MNNLTKITVALVVVAVLAYFWLKPSYAVVGARLGRGSPAVIMLHGFGAPADDLVPLVRTLSKRLRGATFIVPGAPHRTGLLGRSWHPVDSLESAVKGLRDSIEQIHRVIRDAERAGVAPSDIYLAGFSQGAAMAVHVLTESRSAPPIGGLIVLSGMFFTEPAFSTERATDQLPEEFRVLVTHSEDDGVVDVSSGRAVESFFAERGFDVRFVPFEGGHGIPPKVENTVVEFLQEH